MELPPGMHSWMGPYRLSARIATGGMAEIYAARRVGPDGEVGPLVAVKKLLPHLARDASVVRMFLNEARITSQIHHPNVVRVLALDQVDGEPFIAMELLTGRTWAELRERAAEHGRHMPTQVALSILARACRGLDAAHKATDDDGRPLALVHRDFTPDNIHVGRHGEVKVIDFGIAKTAFWSAGTQPGTLKGKFFYMSPEMILARPVDHRADVFAAGVMLYEQLCGRRPFTGTSVDEVVMKIAAGQPTPPSHFDPAVPPALEAICLTALRRDVETRFQSLETMAEAIEAVGGDAQLATPDEVAAYLASLFPEAIDAQEQAVAEARRLDPSSPGALAPAAAAAPAADVSAPPPAPPDVDVAPPVTPPRDATPPPARRRGPLFAGAALVALGAAAFFFLRGPSLSAEERLTRAAAGTPDERAALLAPLAMDDAATGAQLGAATNALLADEAWSAALPLAEAWAVRAPDEVEARLAVAAAAGHSRYGKRAEAALDDAARLAPDDSRPDAARARLKELQGDASGALEAWTRAAEKSKGKDAAEPLARQGYWLSQAGQLDEADASLSRALRLHYDAGAAAELGFVKFRKSRGDEALRLLQEATRRAPDSMVAQYYLGAVLLKRGDLSGARAAYDAADALAVDDSRPLTALCELEALARDDARLEAVKQRIGARFPKEASTLVARCSAPPPE